MEIDKYDCGIYSITAPSGNQYVGSSTNIPRRWSEHVRELKRNDHANSALQNSWNKYNGELAFKKILICEAKDLLLYEQLILDSLKPEYNICKVAGNTLGRIKTPEEIEKQRLVWLGKKHTPETRLKMSISAKGKTRTKEHQEKIAAANRGKKYGPKSEESKRKISESNKITWVLRKARQT